jgi:hypothetical protein
LERPSIRSVFHCRHPCHVLVDPSRRRVALAIITPLLFGVSCRHKTIQVSESQLTVDVTHDPSTVYNVTFTDNTVLVELSTVKRALRSATADGHVWVFDSIPEIQKLQPGSVLLVKGVGMKKVLAVMPFEGKVALLVTDAAITDAIKNGHIHVEREVGLDNTSMVPGGWARDAVPVRLAAMDPSLALFQGTGKAPSGVQAKVNQIAQAKVDQLWKEVSEGSDSANGGLGGCGKVNGWDYCVHGARGASRINLHASLSKNAYGFVGTIKADGYIDNFRMATDLDVDDSKISSFRWDTRNANGLINFQFVGAKNNPEPLSQADRQQEIPLPGSFTMTYLVGPLPLTIKVSEALLVHPGFTGVNQICEANFRMTYNSTQSVSLRKGNIDDEGNVSGTTEILNTNTMLTGPYGFVVALDGPRIEIGFDAASIWGSLTSLVPDNIAQRAATAFLNWQPVKDILNGPNGPQVQQALNLITTTAGAALKSKAAVHLDFVLSTGVLSGGVVTMIPCQRTTAKMTISVGANASLFGMDVKDSLKKTMYEHTWERGPVSGPCAIDKPDGNSS